MAAIHQKIYQTCSWLARPVQWLWNSVSYSLGFSERLITYTEAARRVLQEEVIWQKYAQEYEQSEMWRKIKERLKPSVIDIWEKGNREEFWEVFVEGQFRSGLPKPNPILAQALVNFKKEGKLPGIAIDLGCGASVATNELLARGWKVIAVDSSQVVLDMLAEYVKERFKDKPLSEGSLTLVCSEMETYQFPENVRLIYGNSLPYCNPAKFEQVWKRAYFGLEKGGRLAGEFFPIPGVQEAEIFRVTGAWFTDIQTVKAFSDHQGYRREVCEFDKYWYQLGARTINFMGQKPVLVVTTKV